MKSWIKYFLLLFVLFIVLTMAFSSYGKAMRQFIDLSVNAKNEMMQEFIQYFKDAELKLIKTRAEDVVYSRWSNRFSKNIFNALFLEDFYPSYLSVNCLTLKEERLNDILNKDITNKIIKGFENQNLVHPLCQRCEFRTKFNDKK